MILTTASDYWRKVLTTNSTASAFVVPSDVASDPTGAGYISIVAATVDAPNNMLFKFFGAGSNNQTGSVRIYGVRRQFGLQVWDHTLLFGGQFTLSTAVGVAGGLVSATERYADTLTRDLGIENVADELLSPTSDIPAWLMVDAKGFQKLYVELIVGTATSANAVYCGV